MFFIFIMFLLKMIFEFCIKSNLLDICLVKLRLWVIISILMFFFLRFFMIVIRLLIDVWFSVDVGLLNKSIEGFVISVCVIVIFCFFLLDKVSG